MKKDKIIIIAIAVILIFALYFLFFDQSKEEHSFFSIEESELIAKEWVEKKSPTYSFDGFDLRIIDSKEIEINHYEFLFDFESRSAGYGDRSEEFVAQVITPHQIKVVVKMGEVLEAITDNAFSEKDNIFVETNIENEQNLINETGEEIATISIFFGKEGEEENLISVERTTDNIQMIHWKALEKLIEGPSQEEKNKGYFSSINPKTKINHIETENKTILVDFTNELQEGVAGSSMVIFIRSQINETLKQFPEIDNVIISINGEKEDILQP